MKKFLNKKIITILLAGLFFPVFSFAQTFSEHIQDVQWNLTPGVFSVTGNGVMTTDVQNPSFRWQVEVGFAGDVTTNPNGSLNVSGDVFGYVPADTSNLFTSTPPNLTPISSNQFSFNMPNMVLSFSWRRQ